MTATATAPANRPIILFDGDCALCNASVRFVLRHERAPLHGFCALQDASAANLLGRFDQRGDTLDTVYLLDADGLHTRSTAALRIAATLRRPWRWLALLRVVPKPLRDAVYRLIGRYRLRWFGRSAYCAAFAGVDPSRLLGASDIPPPSQSRNRAPVAKPSQ